MKLALTIFLSTVITNSTPKEEYLDFMGNFMKNSQLSFDFNITQHAEGKTLISKGYYKRSDKEFILKSENYFVLSSKEISITVFEQDKIILLNDPTPANNLFVMDATQFDNVDIKVTESPNNVTGVKQWNISSAGWEGKAIVKADIEKKTPINITLYDKQANPSIDKPVLKIGFSNMSKAAPDKQVFSFASYIYKKGNSWALTPKYSSYELINNLN